MARIKEDYRSLTGPQKAAMAASELLCALGDAWCGSELRQSLNAIPIIPAMVTTAITSRGTVARASPIATATAIFAMNATAIPIIIGDVRYRVERIPVV